MMRESKVWHGMVWYGMYSCHVEFWDVMGCDEMAWDGMGSL